jgi:hypothetical protein
MYPHERSLVKKFEGKPFVLLGVNSDSNKDELKEAMAENQITWRSWWDGGSPLGPIATTWNVRGWPTVYVLDAKSIIRYKHPRDKALDVILERLIAEAETQVRQDSLK